MCIGEPENICTIDGDDGDDGEKKSIIDEWFFFGKLLKLKKRCLCYYQNIY